MQHHLPGFPVQTVEVVHELGGVGGLQHGRGRGLGAGGIRSLGRQVDKSLSGAGVQAERLAAAPLGDVALLRITCPRFSFD